MSFEDEIEKLIPASSDVGIDWEAMESSCLGFFFTQMKKIPQNPEFHGEGNVYIHTRMVCEELLRMQFHDIGKIRTTKSEEGKWGSPHHSSVGSQMTREYLWKTCGLCGVEERI